MGGWSQTGRTCELHYLDPSVGPSTGAWALLGWLAAGDYAAGQLERRAGAPDTDEPGEQSVAALTIRWEDGIFVSS